MKASQPRDKRVATKARKPAPALTRPADGYAALHQGFRWRVPEHFNMAQVCCARWAALPDATKRVAVHVHQAGSAGTRDIRISGGANVIQQYLNIGVIDELEIALAPVLFCGGQRLFENMNEPGPQFRIERVVDSPLATHLRYVRHK